MLKKAMFFIIVVGLALTLVACGGNGDEVGKAPYRKEEFLMGTVVSIAIHDEGRAEVLEEVFVRVRDMADRFSSNDASSEIDEINQNAGIAPVQVSEDTFELVVEGLEAGEFSDGLFDATIGPLTNLWRIGFDDARKPEQSEIDQVLPLINFRNVALNEANDSVFLKETGMMLDLGGIAKGFMTDEVVKILQENNINSAVIDLGGNIYVVGKNTNGQDWSVGVQDPFAERNEVVGSFRTSNMSIVTSGIYERYLEVDGERYHHLLDPKTGYPFENDIAGVTIVSKRSVDGDALSTITFGKGVEEGLAFIEDLEGVEAIVINVDKEVFVTSGLQDVFTVTNDNFTLVER